MESLEEYMSSNGIKGELKLLKGFHQISQFFHQVEEKFMMI